MTDFQKNRWIWQPHLVWAVILISGLVWIWFSRVPQEGLNQAVLSIPYEGFAAPEFLVTDIHGEPVNLSAFRGSPVVLNFWASWCPPCRAEMPALQQVYSEYRESGLALLAINSTYQDNLPDVQNFINQFGLVLPVYLDSDGSASRLYQVKALPTTFFINADGIIEDVEIGGPLAEATIRIKVQDLLRRSGYQ